ncbi:MAG: HAMP domain-containing histidine kinase, partial [Planctomycetes bacterium]|nr:HAMP domain-containing histidine kinase [Planctomycetota bacterium]
GAAIVGFLAHDTFERNMERQTERRMEGNAQLIARQYGPDTLARLLEVKDSTDPLVQVVHAWAVDAADKADMKRIRIITADGRVAIDSADIDNRGMIDYNERINKMEIDKVIAEGKPVCSIMFPLDTDHGVCLFKTAYALVPRAEDTRTGEVFIAAVEMPAGYTHRLERLKLTVTLFVAGFSIFVVLCTYAATKYFNKLQLRIEEQRRKAELAEFSAAIAHEIKNPLGAMLTGVQLLSRGLDEKQRKISDRLEREVHLLDRIVRDFLAFARGAQRQPERTTLSAVIAQVREQLTPEQDRIFESGGDTGVELVVDRVALTQALANLVKNGAQAAMERGLQPSVKLRARTNGSRLDIEVEDNGGGIPTTVREKLFQPFVSGRSDGTGLGLAITRRLIEDIGGRISLIRSSAEGTLFHVTLEMKTGGAI